MIYKNVMERIVIEREFFEHINGKRPNTVILGNRVYKLIKKRFDLYLVNPIRVDETEQLMGMDVTVDYTREWVIGVSYVQNYSVEREDLEQIGE